MEGDERVSGCTSSKKGKPVHGIYVCIDVLSFIFTVACHAQPWMFGFLKAQLRICSLFPSHSCVRSCWGRCPRSMTLRLLWHWWCRCCTCAPQVRRGSCMERFSPRDSTASSLGVGFHLCVVVRASWCRADPLRLMPWIQVVCKSGARACVEVIHGNGEHRYENRQ